MSQFLRQDQRKEAERVNAPSYSSSSYPYMQHSIMMDKIREESIKRRKEIRKKAKSYEKFSDEFCGKWCTPTHYTISNFKFPKENIGTHEEGLATLEDVKEMKLIANGLIHDL
jgi:hypothetical protein